MGTRHTLLIISQLLPMLNYNFLVESVDLSGRCDIMNMSNQAVLGGLL